MHIKLLLKHGAVAHSTLLHGQHDRACKSSAVATNLYCCHIRGVIPLSLVCHAALVWAQGDQIKDVSGASQA